MARVVHIAGGPLQVGAQLRQRCGWCGAVLIDSDLSRMAMPIPEGKTEEQARADGDLRPATWEPGALVAVEGNHQYVVPHEDNTRLPADACGQLAHAVTA